MVAPVPTSSQDRRIDLHTHTTVSDGTDTPTVLVQEAAAAGLDVVAITDHDSVAGWQEAAQQAATTGISLVRGAEISTRCGPVSVHLLAYLFDPEDPALAAELGRVRSARLDRARAMVDLVARDYPITWEDVLAQTADGTTVGRPHLADALVAAGSFPDRSAVFRSVLAGGSPYYVPHYAIDVTDAVRMVRAAGGVPVLAHPGAADRGRVLDDPTIAGLAAAGLAGLEADHRDHDAQTRARLRRLAADLGLRVTGSSDYHGAGKENRLGENLTDQAVLDEIVAQAEGVELL